MSGGVFKGKRITFHDPEVPMMAVRVIERAIQIHGGAGVSQDTPLAGLYSSIRYLRLADGPDEVHLRTIAKEELGKYLD